MRRYEAAADFAVRKAVLFAGLAIVTTMLGIAFDFALAARTGAWMALILAGLLLWFEATAGRRRPEDTETWLLLPADARPNSGPARQVFCVVMRETYAHYARLSLRCAVTLFAIAVILRLAGLEVGFK